MDFEGMGFKELTDLIDQALAARQERELEERNKCLFEVLQLVKLRGFTISQLFPDKAEVKPKKPAKVKYADGNGNTWTGRGNRPKWFQAALDSGVSVEALAVQ